MAEIDKYAQYDEPDGPWIKEPGTFSGTKVHDIIPIKGGNGARLAARLCNFPTDKSALRMSHRNWLDHNLRPVIPSLQWAWIDLTGYASRLGPSGHNYTLSAERCKKVQAWIEEYGGVVKFNNPVPMGASASSTNATNNDGYYRAVDVCVYGFKPPTATPSTVVGSKRFKIREVVMASYGKSVPNNAVGGSVGGETFEIVDLEAHEKATFAHGSGSFTLSLPIGPGASFSDTGPWKFFQTSAPVQLSDFEGKATLFQSPGVQIASWSVGGHIYLSIDSDKLLLLAARITPTQILELETGDGYSGPSMAIGIPAPFKMVGTTIPFWG